MITSFEYEAVDRHRVECDGGHPGYCKVVNGAPFRGEIVGFGPEHDYNCQGPVRLRRHPHHEPSL